MLTKSPIRIKICVYCITLCIKLFGIGNFSWLNEYISNVGYQNESTYIVYLCLNAKTPCHVKAQLNSLKTKNQSYKSDKLHNTLKHNCVSCITWHSV